MTGGPGSGPGKGDTPGVTHPFQQLDEAQGLLEAAPAQPTEDTVLQETGAGAGEHRDGTGTAPGNQGGYPGDGGLHRGLPRVATKALPRTEGCNGGSGGCKGACSGLGLPRWRGVYGKPG